jgi:hypothetical protein
MAKNKDTGAGNSGNNSNLSRYETDVSGVSMKNLEAGLWWVKNRGKLKKGVIAVLLAICVISVGYALFGFGHYFLKGMWDDRKLVSDLVNTTTVSPDFLEQRAAKDLSLSAISVLENGSTYDLYLSVQNPNPRHWGSFSYCFKTGEIELECGTDFLLPNEKKIISALGLKISSRPTNARFIINQIGWKKLSAHDIPDWSSYKNERLQIEIKNVSFKPAAASDLSEKISLNSLSFSASNRSAYGFWEAPLTIILYRSNRIVGISKYTLKELASYDTREINITWPGDLSGVNDIDIIPDINIMNEGNYLRPGR